MNKCYDYTHTHVYSRRECAFKPFQSVKVGGSEKRFDAKAVWGDVVSHTPSHIGETITCNEPRLKPSHTFAVLKGNLL